MNSASEKLLINETEPRGESIKSNQSLQQSTPQSQGNSGNLLMVPEKPDEENLIEVSNMSMSKLYAGDLPEHWY